MPQPSRQPPRAPRPAWWAGPARTPYAIPALVLTLLAARVAWQVLASDLTLAEDEAHYWEWSRRLDWSYYSKGPGVAWVIRAATELFGHTEWAVRLPAAIAGALGVVAAAATARWAFEVRAPEHAFTSAALFACIPAFALASVLMTIDAPYVACWAWAGAFAALALLRGHRGAWLGLGLAVGVGFLFKFTILLLVPGVALAAWATRRDRPRVHAPSALAGAALAALGLLPVLLWNARHDWATLRHLIGHLGLPGGDAPPAAWSPRWPLEYLGVHLLTAGPVLILSAVAWARTRQADPRTRAGVRFCVAAALPVFAFYLLVSFFTRVEGNWAVAGAATLAPPAAWAVLDGIRRRSLPVRACWGAALAAGLLATAAPALLGFLSTRRVIGEHVPVQRLTGMREHAAAVARELDALGQLTGREPFVMTDHYGRASQLAFYLPGRPIVYNAASLLGGRPAQHDLWPRTNLRDPDTDAALAGRPALLIGRPSAHWAPLFRAVRPLGPLDAEPDGRTTYVGTGYRGPDPSDRGEPHGQ